MKPIPFKLPDMGLREITGEVSVEDGYLIIKVQDALLGILDSDKDIIKIEPAALDAIYVKPGIFKDKLVVAPRKMELLNLMPGEHQGAVELHIWKTYRPEVQRLVDAFEALA